MNKLYEVLMPFPIGVQPFWLSEKEYSEMIGDPVKYFGAYYGVSPEVFIEWVNAGGKIQCAAINKNGRRCPNQLDGYAYQDNPRDWYFMLGEYCKKHGGPDSMEVRKRVLERKSAERGEGSN